MAMDRALIVDSLPPSRQPAGHAWAAKMHAIGSVIGFFVGKAHLPNILPFLGSTQIQILSILSAFTLVSSHFSTAMAVREEVQVDKCQPGNVGPIQKVINDMKNIWETMWTLPRVIRQICLIQFCASTGWFPVGFFTSVYISDLNKREFYTYLKTSGIDPSNPEIIAQISSLDDDSSRLASRAFFYSSLVTLVFGWVIPLFVTSFQPDRIEGHHSNSGSFLRVPEGLKIHLSTLWALGHLLFAVCMFGTFFTTSVLGATTIITITGFCTAIGLWAPSALLGAAILTEPGLTNESPIRLAATNIDREASSRSSVTCTTASGSTSDLGDGYLDDREAAKKEEGSTGFIREYPLGDDLNNDEETTGLVQRLEDEELADVPRNLGNKAGVIFGIQNIFIVIPQFLVTGISSIIFAIFDSHPEPSPHTSFESSRNSTVPLVRAAEEGQAARSDSVVYVFGLGGIAALVACVLSLRLTRMLHKNRGN